MGEDSVVSFVSLALAEEGGGFGFCSCGGEATATEEDAVTSPLELSSDRDSGWCSEALGRVIENWFSALGASF